MKRSLLFRGPVTSSSGYGNHARQFLRAIIQMDAFDLALQETSWGDSDPLPGDGAFAETVRVLAQRGRCEAGRRDYDVGVCVSMPCQFERLGRITIGVTAGIETDRVTREWIDRVNESVDLVIVPSAHAKRVFEETQYPGTTLRRPVVVCPLGIPTALLEPVAPADAAARFPFDSEWNFLFVGLGLHQPMGEDRKNIGPLIRWFCETFRDDARVGLVLKTSIGNAGAVDRELTFRRVAAIADAVGARVLPRVYLVHGALDDREMAMLYRHPQVKAFISLTHGEGFGLPLLEAAACGLPVIATDWSGHLDFLSVDGERRRFGVDYDLRPIPPSFAVPGIADPEARWAYPHERHAKTLMRRVVDDYATIQPWAEARGRALTQKYAPDCVARAIAEVLRPFAQLERAGVG